jgi:hypothetical protein
MAAAWFSTVGSSVSVCQLVQGRSERNETIAPRTVAIADLRPPFGVGGIDRVVFTFQSSRFQARMGFRVR